MLTTILISLGMTLRSLILLNGFLILFIVGSIIALFLNSGDVSSWFITLTPLILTAAVLLFALVSPSIRDKLTRSPNEEIKGKSEKTPSKYVLAFACYAVFVVVGVFVMFLCLALQLDKYLFEIFGIYVFLGWIPIYIFMWPFFKRNMKQ